MKVAICIAIGLAIQASALRHVHNSTAATRPMEPLAREIDLPRFMGCWYVQANIPTYIDEGSTNNIESYSFDPEESRIDVTFQFTKDGVDTLSYQKGWVNNEYGSLWRLHPQFGAGGPFLPLDLPWILIYLNEDYTSSIVGYTDNKYLWIMTREVTASAAEVERLIGVAETYGYNKENIVMVQNDIPQTPEICP